MKYLEYIVIDDSGDISRNLESNAPEKFETLDAAQDRALELTQFAPGHPIRIFALVGVMILPAEGAFQ